jgi:uncharacterized protein
MRARVRRKLTGRLMAAILGGDAATVRSVLRSRIDPAAPDRFGTTPLYLASVQGQAEVARILLTAGARPNVESGIGRPATDPLAGTEGLPLCAAASHGHLEAVRVLLEFGADPNLREDGGAGYAPLDWALLSQDAAVIDVLRALGARSPALGGHVDRFPVASSEPTALLAHTTPPVRG